MQIHIPKHILVPVDGSPTSSYAAGYAAMLQQQFRCQVTLVYVFGYPASDVTNNSTVMRLALEEERKEGSAVLDKVKDTYYGPDVAVDTLVLEGSVSDVLVETITEGAYDLVVMGSQGLGSPLQRFFIGSVTKHILSKVEKPILVVRAPREDA